MEIFGIDFNEFEMVKGSLGTGRGQTSPSLALVYHCQVTLVDFYYISWRLENIVTSSKNCYIQNSVIM